MPSGLRNENAERKTPDHGRFIKTYREWIAACEGSILRQSDYSLVPDELRLLHRDDFRDEAPTASQA
jgi:hypothetical protein